MRTQRRVTVRTIGAVAIAAVVAALLVSVGAPATPVAADGNEAPGNPFGFRSISAGDAHTCAITVAGAVKCWGDNQVGQLGLGNTANRGDNAGEMGDNLLAVNLGTGRTATAITTGLAHTCALLDNATVKCWGYNNRGQLGLGDTATRGDNAGEMGDTLPAVNLGTGRTATAITAGFYDTCALLDNATVKCWGSNDLGQLGQGDTATRGDNAGETGDNLPAVNLGTGRTATAITAGGLHTCALLDNATVKCWGLNNLGQLGQGDTATRGDNAGEMGDSLPGVSLGTGRTATAITAGGGHTCALLDNATVKCWGANSSGRLGLGDTANRGDAAGEMGDTLPAISLGAGRTATAITASEHTCALLNNATIKCWGNNLSGGLGLGDTTARGDAAGEMGDTLPAASLGTGRTAIAITAGSSHTCTLLDNATIKCWGENTGGQLGQGDNATRGDNAGEMGDALPVVDLGGSRSVRAVTAGLAHSCAVLDSGSLRCWGANGQGQLGLGDIVARGDGPGELANALPAVDLGAGRTAVSVAASPAASAAADFTCALLDNGQVKCWGANLAGQLGQGDIFSRGASAGTMGDNLAPINLGTGRTATSIAVGGSHACARLDNGSVKCWGINNVGQLGLGDTNNRGWSAGQMGDNLPAVNLGAGRTATALALGQNFSCARLDNGSVKCWGLNTDGQLGRGDTASRGGAANQMGDNLAAVNLGTGRTATAIAAGLVHVCASLDNGSVKCWGSSSNGQLGLGDTASRGDGANEMGDNLPAVALGTGRSAGRVFAGGTYSCARLDNAAVKCWGRADSGQLGQGDTTQRGDGPGEMGDSLPALNLGTGRTATTLAAGGAHLCGLLDDATVRCWGFNSSGQLGRGDTANRGDGAGEMGDNLGAVPMGGTNAPTGITGRLTETGTGRAITRAHVLVMRTTDFSIAGAAVSDGAGAFTAYAAPGAYFLYLVDPTGNHTAAFNGAPGATLTTVAVDSVATANPTMATTRGTISGTVTEAVSNLPLANQVVISLGGPSVSMEGSTTTDDAGGYVLRDLPTGNHWIGFLDPTGGHRTTFWPNSPDVPSATPVATTPNSTPTANAQLPTQTATGTGATITGTVTDTGTGTPLAGALVIALDAADYRTARIGVTNAAGAYSLDLQATVGYKLAFIDPTNRHEQEWHDNQPRTGLASATTVVAPGLANADIVATGGTVTGTVTDNTTSPVGGVIVLAIGPTGPAGSTTTAGDGTYTLRDLPPGTYRAAFVDPTGVRAVEYWNNSTDYAGATAFNVTANTTTPNISPSLNRR